MNKPEPFAVAVIRDLGPWREFLASEVLLEMHKRGCCEDVLATLGEIERRHQKRPDECELRVVTANREVPAGEVFLSVLAVLVTDIGVDSQGRRVLKLWYGWARPGLGGPALRWGADRLNGIRKAHRCQAIETCSGRSEGAYARWIERNLGLQRVTTLYKKVFTD
ncbi:MAG: hypothetical protein HZC54_00650 [Verrucomicrobia bacterium]|nr:hypothetical protein [Verrucomicrobiota bacterium]